MSQFKQWQEAVSNWYQHRKHDQVDQLIPLLKTPPNEIWGPETSNQQSKGLSCWLDGCLRVYQYNLEHNNPQLAYQYLNFAVAKLQFTAGNQTVDSEIKIWCIERLEQLIILLLEFCSQQFGDSWVDEQHQQIECHIKFVMSHPYKPKKECKKQESKKEA